MRFKRQFAGKIASAVGAACLLGALGSASAQADTTGFLSPTTSGTYQVWLRSDMVTEVNDSVGCPGNNANWATSPVVPQFGRASAVIDLASIPEDATIDSIDIQVCQTRGTLGGNDATFQLFTRVDGADIDSGVDIDTNDDPNVRVVSVQTIPLGIQKDVATSIEIGAIKTSADNVNATRIYTLSANINFTPAGSMPPPPPSATEAVPVFGPFGLVFTILGMGLVGFWQLRRKR